MKTKLLKALGSLFGLILFGLALWVLHQELKVYNIHDILRNFHGLPLDRLLLAILLTVFSYLIMTCYDVLALRYVQHQLAYSKIALASFIGYAFSNNIGLSMVAGASVRYRLYSSWGLSALEITKIVAFCTMTLWLGFFALGGVVFLVEPMVVPAALHLPFASVRQLGLIFLLLVGCYLVFGIARKQPFRVKELEFALPPQRLVLPQIAVAIVDWILAGSILYVLLPSSPSLNVPGFLGIYLLAQMAGLMSQVPGGLGIFEAIIVLLLSPLMPASMILGSLLAYRGIYYLLPLVAAAVLLGIQEMIQRMEGIQRGTRALGQWVPLVVPPLLAFSTFVGGVLLLFSGATPGVGSRMDWLNDLLPLPVIEVSHFLGSLVGVGLLVLAWGLQRRMDAAYILTSILLAFGSIFSLLKGLDYEEALILSIMLLALLPCHRFFYRKASLVSERFTPGWIAAILLVLFSSVWLVLFSYKHVDYSNDLWWQFALTAHAPRSLRAMVGSIVVVLLFAFTRLLHPAKLKVLTSTQEDMDRATAIVRQSPLTYANLALLGDKAFLFSQAGSAFIMYNVKGRSWVALGDPVGPQEEWSELIWQFWEMCDRNGGWPVFYEVGIENLPIYLDLGLTLLKLGEEARVPLEMFFLEGKAHKNLRYTHHKLEKEGCSFEVIAPEAVPALIPDFKRISDAWLEEKNTSEKGFSLGFFNAEYLKHYPQGIVRKDGKIVAFANIWQGNGKEELSVDLMRYLSVAPPGVMEYLFIELMLWGRQEGYRWFNLGMAPLSGLEARSLGPLWNKIGAFIFGYGEYFYNFQGLRLFKAKFEPEWHPKYLASPATLSLPLILTNIASLTSGGLKGIIAK